MIAELISLTNLIKLFLKTNLFYWIFLCQKNLIGSFKKHSCSLSAFLKIKFSSDFILWNLFAEDKLKKVIMSLFILTF